MALRRQSERLIIVLRWVLLVGIALVLGDSGGPLVAQLDWAAETDSLTGLLNKRALFERLNGAVHRVREQGTAVSMTTLDLDDVGAFNDQFGQLVADNVLSAVAEVLRTNTRADDVRCRFGGDEFVLVLPLCERDHAARIADTVRRDTAALWLNAGGIKATGLGVSIGTATFPADASTGAGLLREADFALLRDKRSRRQHAGTRLSTLSPQAGGGTVGGAA